MKKSVFLAAGIMATILSFSTSAYAQTVESCNAQCWQTYNTRVNYCYGRYGGYNYDAELCIMNEYEVLVDCMNNCETTYGGSYSELRIGRVPGVHGSGHSCG